MTRIAFPSGSTGRTRDARRDPGVCEDPRFYRHGGIDIIEPQPRSHQECSGRCGPGRLLDQPAIRKERAGAALQHNAVATRTQSRHEVLYGRLGSTQPGRPASRAISASSRRSAIPSKSSRCSKNDILMGYLNIANFGGTTYGIEAAARYYSAPRQHSSRWAQLRRSRASCRIPTRSASIDLRAAITDADGRTYNKAADSTVDDVTAGTLAGLDSSSPTA